MVNVIICDESETYMEQMKKDIEQIVAYNGYDMILAMLTTDKEELLDYASKDESISLYILDVTYRGCQEQGLELAKHIRSYNRDAYIVFNTKDQSAIYHVMKGLIRPAGFFEKPFVLEDLKILLGDIYRDYMNLRGGKEEVFHVNIGSDIHQLPYDQIIYFESLHKKTYIHTHNQRIGFYESLVNIKSRLGHQFLRCHRSYLVNIHKIKKTSFTDMVLVMENNVVIDISRTYKKTVRRRLEDEAKELGK